MHEPLPDSSVLEAGMIEDPDQARLSSVFDHVRALLRSPGRVSLHSTPPHTPPASQMAHGLPTPPDSPAYSPHPAPLGSSAFAAVVDTPPTHRYPACEIPRPAARPPQQQPVNAASLPFFADPEAQRVALTTPAHHQPGMPIHLSAPQPLQPTHESTMFNTRALAALDHPDLSDPWLTAFLRQKSQERSKRCRGWTRGRKSQRKEEQQQYRQQQRGGDPGTSTKVLCVLSGLLLSAAVATCTFFKQAGRCLRDGQGHDHSE